MLALIYPLFSLCYDRMQPNGIFRVVEMQPGLLYKAWFFYRMNVIVRKVYERAERLGGINPDLSSECVQWRPFSSLRSPFRTAGGFCMLWLISSIVFLQHGVNHILLTRALSYVLNCQKENLTSKCKKAHGVVFGFWETSIGRSIYFSFTRSSGMCFWQWITGLLASR